MYTLLELTSKSIPGAAIIALCVVVLTAGCNQHRYTPSKWRPAARQSTLPVAAGLSGTAATLPMRNWSSLPFRGGTTLPNRHWSTLPNRGGMTTLPNRNWSTLPQRGGRSGTTLPNRQLYPEYFAPRRDWTTLPEISPLRDRRGGSTLPMRINSLR